MGVGNTLHLGVQSAPCWRRELFYYFVTTNLISLLFQKSGVNDTSNLW